MKIAVKKLNEKSFRGMIWRERFLWVRWDPCGVSILWYKIKGFKKQLIILFDDFFIKILSNIKPF